jgi:tyrosinase
MPNLASVRDRTWSLFLQPSPPQRAAFREAIPSLAAEAVEGEEPIESFSVFDKRHLARAMEVVAEMMRRANAASEEQGLQAVLDYYEEMRGQENPDLVDYALMVFITHHPRGRALTHSIPPITLRNPELVAPSTAAPERALGGPGLMGLEAEPELGVEAVSSDVVGGAIPTDNLEWYREDPFANEHHTHWHVVYPTVGVPDPNDPDGVRFKDRQGEVFFYMHQQMLARYDAERVAQELDRVKPLADYRVEVIGYDPGPYLRRQGFPPRPAGRRMVSIPGRPGVPEYRVSDHETRRERLKKAVADLEFAEADPVIPMDKVILLGSTVENNDDGIGAVAGRNVEAFYGNLHNIGHVMLALASTGGSGVMRTPQVAIRDPVFWEWHKHIDNFYAAWQENKGAQPFNDRPMVRLRKQLDPAADRASSPDIILAFEDQLPAAAAGGGLRSWARESFGGDHWDEDFGETATTTATLETAMLQRQLTLADRVTTVPLEHLTHRPFVYVFRIENQVDRRVQVTVRVFLVPGSQATDRRAWIEMDKFVHSLEPLEKSVVARRGSQSSVIRKPAVMSPELLKEDAILMTQQDFDAMLAEGLPASIANRLQPFVGQPVAINFLANALGPDWNRAVPFIQRHFTFVPSEQPQRPGENDSPEDIERVEASNYCTCGWPYNLLLPRGTEEGMPFRLAVICSDWEIDQVGGEESCGSLSFCGARDSYPDKRDMGYPFDRPFEVPIADTVMANGNMAFRDITIRRMPDVVDDGNG